jgi:hypothetical protein
VIWTGSPPNASTSSTTPWEENVVASGGYVTRFLIDNGSPQGYVCDGTRWNIYGGRTDFEFRWKLVDPDALQAIPPTWRDQVQTDGAFLGWLTLYKETQTAVQTDVTQAATCNGSTGWWHVGGAVYLAFPKSEDPSNSRTCGLFSNSGGFSAPVLGSQTLAAGYSNGVCPTESASQVILEPIPTNGIAMRIPVV